MANRNYTVTLTNGSVHNVRAHDFTFYGGSAGVQFYRELPFANPDPDYSPNAMDHVNVAMFMGVESVVMSDEPVEE